jgi:hypothetical protein
MEFVNGSGKEIQTVFPDNFHFFELLAKLVEEEPADVFDPLSRFQMQAIGIGKGSPQGKWQIPTLGFTLVTLRR